MADCSKSSQLVVNTESESGTDKDIKSTERKKPETLVETDIRIVSMATLLLTEAWKQRRSTDTELFVEAAAILLLGVDGIHHRLFPQIRAALEKQGLAIADDMSHDVVTLSTTLPSASSLESCYCGGSVRGHLPHRDEWACACGNEDPEHFILSACSAE